MEDTQIVQLYWDRDQAAITQSDLKYGSYCFCVSNNILGSPEDAEECVSDTWMGAWEAMPPHRPQLLRMFFAKITRRISINRLEARNAEKRGGGEIPAALEELTECVGTGPDVEEQTQYRALVEAINVFLRGLPERDGNLFLRRYFFGESIRLIAREYGITENNANVNLSRTRKKLREYLRKEGWIYE